MQTRFRPLCGGSEPGPIAGSLHRLLTDAFPELADDDTFSEKLYKDLYAEGLIVGATLKMQIGPEGVFGQSHTTELGNHFLAFISKREGLQ